MVSNFESNMAFLRSSQGTITLELEKKRITPYIHQKFGNP